MPASGSTSYSLGDRDESWDAGAAEGAMSSGQLGQMHFWKDPDGDAGNKSSYKLPFAEPNPSPHAVWKGVTAAAAAVQGSRGGVSIPDSDMAGVKSRIASYYGKASKKYDDDTIVPPWKATVAPSALHAAEMASVGLYWKGDGWTFETYSDKHRYAGDGGDCKICGKPGSDKDAHYASEEEAFADGAGKPAPETPNPDRKHAYSGDGNEPCKICGQAAAADIHNVEEAALGGEDAAQGGPWTARLFTEGTLSRDGRMIAEGAAQWGQLPIPLMGMIEDTGLGGHSGSQISGPMEDITRQGNDIIATGHFDTSDWAQNIQRLVQDGTMRGISVDLAPIEWRIEAKPMDQEAMMPILIADGEEKEDGEGREIVAEEAMDDMVFVVTKGEIMGATVCPMPAFANAEIHLTADGQPGFVRLYGEISMVADASAVPDTTGEQNPTGATGCMIALYPTPEQQAQLSDPDKNLPASSLHCTLFYFPEAPDSDKMGALLESFAMDYDAIQAKVGGCGQFAPNEEDPNDSEGAPQILLVTAPGLADMRAQLAAALIENEMFFSTKFDFTPHITVDYGDPADYVHNVELLGQPLTFDALSFVNGPMRTDYRFITAMTASAAGLVPDKPPLEWFQNPQLSEPTPLTVTPEGRVYGHAATWNVCHIAHTNTCITAPHSKHDYGYFMLGEVETAEGERIACGTITLDTGHAPESFGRMKTRAHYDDTGTGAADVVVGEDEHGVWMAGAIRPDLTAGHVRKLRAAKISGDWRDVNGSLELVALLAVNVPGFPVPRPKAQLRRSNGDIKGLALVAAGIVGEDVPEPVEIRTPVPEEVTLKVMSIRASGGMEGLYELVAGD